MTVHQFRFAIVPVRGILKAYSREVDYLPEFAMYNPENADEERIDYPNYWEGVDSTPFARLFEEARPERES